MSRHETGRGGAHVGPNLTPMVDVVMCILIFFLLSSSLATAQLYLSHATPKGPRGPTQETVGEEHLPAVRHRLTVSSAGGRARVAAFGVTVEDLDGSGGAAVTLPKLLAAKRTVLAGDAQLVLAVDKNVRYQDAITVYDACLKAGFGNVAFAR